MSLSMALLVLLVAVNVAAVLLLIRPEHGFRACVRPAAEPPLEIDPQLQELIDEVESAPSPQAPRSHGEAGLAESIRRWRSSGKNAPAAAGSCRFEHTA